MRSREHIINNHSVTTFSEFTNEFLHNVHSLQMLPKVASILSLPVLQMLVLLTSLASLLSVSRAEDACRPRPLGLMDHTIRDWQLAASSVVSRAEDPDCAVKHARLFAEGNKAWCPEQRRENEWILVDLGV